MKHGQRRARFLALRKAADEVAVRHRVGLGPRLGLTHQSQHVFGLSIVVRAREMLEELVVHFDAGVDPHTWEGPEDFEGGFLELFLAGPEKGLDEDAVGDDGALEADALSEFVHLEGGWVEGWRGG